MSDEKIYVGNAKKITTQYGDLMKLSLTAEDVEKMSQNLDNGWINIVLKERRAASATGFTHYLEVDTWKPNTEGNTSEKSETAGSEGKKAPAQQKEEISVEDLPF